MTADLDRGLVQEPSSEGAPTRRDARAALACSVLVAVGFAVSVLVTVGKGNLDVVALAALAVGGLAWTASRRFVDAVGVRRGLLATASVPYLRAYTHALGWPARAVAAVVWTLWLLPSLAVLFFVGSLLIRVLMAAAS